MWPIQYPTPSIQHPTLDDLYQQNQLHTFLINLASVNGFLNGECEWFHETLLHSLVQMLQIAEMEFLCDTVLLPYLLFFVCDDQRA